MTSITPADLRNARESLGLTQKRFAEALGVTTMAVSHWESGRRPMPPWMSLAIEGYKARAV